MGEKTPKGKKRKPVNRPEVAPDSAFSNETESINTLDSSLAESLVRSHAELCAVLRLAGRQILRLDGDRESLEKIRQTLKKAEALRRLWRSPERKDPAIPVPVEAPAPEETVAPENVEEKPERKRAGRLTRPHPHRILRFPPGGSSR